MKRLAVVLLALGLLAAPLAVEAQGPGKVPRVGYVWARVSSEDQRTWEVAQQGLRELGYVEGQNIALEVRWAEGRYERLPALVAELVRLKVDVLVVGTTPGALAAKSATRTIPIVMYAVGDPVGSGLVASLAHPGGNLTGAEPVQPGGQREAPRAPQGMPPGHLPCSRPHESGESDPCCLLERDPSGSPGARTAASIRQGARTRGSRRRVPPPRPAVALRSSWFSMIL
jgi:hypothetical protein